MIICGLFVMAYSAYENAISDVFTNYSLGELALDGSVAERFVLPKDKSHSLSLARAGQQQLFWGDAGKVIERASNWFDGGFKIGDALRTHKNALDKSRKVRNYIAHRSDEAWSQFRGVWLSDIGPTPLTRPHPGEFLLRRKQRASSPTFFEEYTDAIAMAVKAACGVAS